MPIVIFVLLAANPYLDQAKALYDGLQFERCLGRLEQAAQVPSTDDERVDIEVYGGLCAFSLGREALAKDHFEVALKLNPAAQLPRLTSPRIVQLFEKLGAELKQKAPPPPTPEPAPVAPAPEVKPPPPVEVVAVPPVAEPKRRAWWLPATFTGASAVAAAIATGFGVSARGHEKAAHAAFDGGGLEIAIASASASARSDALAANITWAIAGGLLAISLVTWLVVALSD